MTAPAPAPPAVDLPAFPFTLSVAANSAAAIAASADPEAALRDLIRQSLHAVLASKGYADYLGSVFHLGLTAGHDAVARSEVLHDMIRQAYASGREASKHTLHLDAGSIDGLAAALSASAQSAPPPVVHVHVPEPKPRRQLATELDDGRVLLEDVADDA
jgi:hypothetical protein